MTAAPRPHVFTIPSSAPFLPTLIEALLDGRLVHGFPASGDPLALASATLYLPTRRAVRLARDVFLDVTGTSAAILPRFVAIGDVDEDEIVFSQAATPGTATETLDLPPALGSLERRLLLAQLVARWAASPDVRGERGAPLVASNPAAALALADDLARLIDDMTTRKVPWSRLDSLVPDHLDVYWQLTLRFLTIARDVWPAILSANGMIESAERRDRLLAAEAKRLAAHPDAPVIVAGSTGSMPATAMLIASVARLPHGAVVLPGLDTDLDEATWDRIPGVEAENGAGTSPVAGHPQFALQALLRRIGIKRADVAPLGATAPGGRERLVSETFRPAATTDAWRDRVTDADFAIHADGALQQVALIEAANPEQEALAVAICLREALEEPGRTAALVTPDRNLARRVFAALDRWKVAVDDSGGEPLADMPAGVFARLAAEVALDEVQPVPLLALLKHRLCRLGMEPASHARTVALLERLILRGPRPRPGTAGLQGALATFGEDLDRFRRGEESDLHGSDPRTRLQDEDVEAAQSLVAALAVALAPLESLDGGQHDFGSLAARHRQVIDALSAPAPDTAPLPPGAPDGVETLNGVFEDLAASTAATSFKVRRADYPDLFRMVIDDRTVRRPARPTARVRIFGPLEARLTQADRVVLGGLNEASWPPDARSDAWLSRPMRLDLGLDPPERRISLSAHDFAQMMGNREVILSRAAKDGGAPTVASRFVQRLAAVAGERWDGVRQRGERYIEWARRLDEPAEVRRTAKPAPAPKREARPLVMSVTDVEHWLRDPYTIYARHILKLRELDPVDLAPGAADRGIIIHGALSEFTTSFATGLPDDPLGALLAIGRRRFAPLKDFPEAIAFWWPRFERIARWFIEWEIQRRANVARLLAESSGRIQFPVGERTFTLRTRADRIERLTDGTYAILDYKTGSVPTEKQVRIGISPQLTLEAAILHHGGFADIPQGSSVAELTYVSLKGGALAGRGDPLIFKEGGDASAHAELAFARLREVANRFEDESQPYTPLVLSMWKNRYGAYDHLARVKEWSVGGDDAEGEET